jgi:hypothetical protein
LHRWAAGYARLSKLARRNALHPGSSAPGSFMNIAAACGPSNFLI